MFRNAHRQPVLGPWHRSPTADSCGGLTVVPFLLDPRKDLVLPRGGRKGEQATTNLYLHFLGTGADVAGLDWLNDTGHRGAQKDPGGHQGGTRRREGQVKRRKPRPFRIEMLTETGFSPGGAEGIRTPGLLIANETRYQLRHSPKR